MIPDLKDIRNPSWLMRVGVHAAVFGVSVTGMCVLLWSVTRRAPIRAGPETMLEWVCAGACFAGVFLSLAAWWWGLEHLLGLLDRHEYGLCLRCSYDLRSTESPGRCPECGTAFEIGEVREGWERYLGKLRGKPEDQ